MRIGQTSAISFASRVTSSLLGAVATLYFARFLGAGVIGQYALFLAVLHWLKIGGTTGLTSAITKRISEGEEQKEFLAAGLLIQFGILLFFSIPLLFAQDLLNNYFGVTFSYLLVLMLLVDLAFTYLSAVLNGQHKVHVSALLRSVRRGLRSVLQIGLAIAGLKLFGILSGYIIAGLVITVVGIHFVSLEFTLPERKHFERILSYAKYSWLGGLKGSTFSWMDTLVLSLFVTNELIGIYEVSWSIASLLVVFGGAIGQAVFPEISELSNAEELEEVRHIAGEALAFTGLFILPGLVGGLVIGDRILFIYGSEFTQGHAILIALIVARLFDTFQAQFSNIFNAIDRPDIGFRINAIIIVSNLVLNLTLVAALGWIGAAVATLISAALGLSYAYHKTIEVVGIGLPIEELAKQTFAAMLMGGAIYLIAGSIQLTRILPVLGVVILGAMLYFSTLTVVSGRFRTVILENVSGLY